MHLGSRRTPPQSRSLTSRRLINSPSAFSRRVRNELRGRKLDPTGIAERLLYLALLDTAHPRNLTPEEDWDPQFVRLAERRYHKTLRLVTSAHDRRLRAERIGTNDPTLGIKRLLHSTKLPRHQVAGLVEKMRVENKDAMPSELFDDLGRYCASLSKHHAKPRRSPGGKFARRLCSLARELDTIAA